MLVAKAWNVQRRQNIGKAKPSDPPPHVDYDLWVGPAEWEPYQENRFHYNWHWTYNFGGGGSGGDGPHEIDYARWGLGVETHPRRAAARRSSALTTIEITATRRWQSSTTLAMERLGRDVS